MSELESLPDEEPRSASFLPYAVSTLSPKIIPNDLTTFKSRGINKVERQLQQELKELHERYKQLVDQFNWNKVIYEAKFGFEPIIGETYHLYDVRGQRLLSMIAPEEFKGQKWVGTFRLNADGQWELHDSAEDFNIESFVQDEAE